MPTAVSLVLSLSIAVANAAAGPPPGPAEPPQSVFERAETLWQAEDDEGVVVLFRRAYAADPRPEYLYGQARAEASLGRCDRAITLLRRFLATDPPAEQAQPAERDIEACGGTVEPPQPVASEVVEPAPPREPEDGSGVVARPTDPDSEPDPGVPPHPEDRPIALRHDRVALGLVVSGSSVAAGGVATLVAGLVLQRRPAGTGDEDDWAQRIRTGRTLATAGAVIGSVGATLLISGIVELVVRRRRDARGLARVSRTSWAVGRPPASASSR